MDQNTHPTADHDFTEQELATATRIAQAAAAKYRPSYYARDFLPHFWVVAGIATLIRELGGLNALNAAVAELESIDAQIQALVMSADVAPEGPSPDHFVSWIETLRAVRKLIANRDQTIASTEKATNSEAPGRIKHMFCGLRRVLDRLFAELEANGYTGGPINMEAFQALTAAVDFRSIFRPEQEHGEHHPTAVSIQQQLQEALGPDATVRVELVRVESEDEFKKLIDAIDQQAAARKDASPKEDTGNGSIH